MSNSYRLMDPVLRSFEIQRLQEQASLLLSHEFHVWGAYIDMESDVLDLGCGVGVLGEFLRTNGYCKKYTGVDFNDALLEEARSLFGDLSLRFVKKDICSLDAINSVIEDVSPSVIFVRYVLQHLPLESAGNLIRLLLRVQRNYRTVLIDAEDSLVSANVGNDLIQILLDDKRSTQASRGGNRDALQEVLSALNPQFTLANDVISVRSGERRDEKQKWLDVYWPVITSGDEFKKSKYLQNDANLWRNIFLEDAAAVAEFGLRVAVLDGAGTS